MSAEISLMARSEDDSAKCRNCQFWRNIPGSCLGSCNEPKGASRLHTPVHTTDLTVCSYWTRRQE
jgi:hypothetical protein